MRTKIIVFLASVAPVLAALIMFLGYQLDQKSYDLEKRKFQEGDIPKKSLKIIAFGGHDIASLLLSLDKANVSITVAGEEIKNLYSISYKITNTGDAPILENDFSERLTLNFSENWKILTFKESRSYPKSLRPEWEKISARELTLKPLLINPNDSIWLEVYLNKTEEEDFDFEELQKQLNGIWSVRIPNLNSIDIVDPFSPPTKSKPYSFLDTFKSYSKHTPPGYATLWRAGFLIFPSKWGVYAIIILAAFMICVYLNLLHPLKLRLNINKQLTIFCIALISVFSFTASEAYITFFTLIGKNVPLINYFFMTVYLISIIYLFLQNYKWGKSIKP